MTVKQLVKKLQHPPCKRIAAVRIEFTDGGIYDVSPDTLSLAKMLCGVNGFEISDNQEGQAEGANQAIGM